MNKCAHITANDVGWLLRSYLMGALVLLAATAALPAGAFAQTDNSSQGIEETGTEIGYRFDAASTILRLIPVFIVGAGIAGFIIWNQKHKKL